MKVVSFPDTDLTVSQIVMGSSDAGTTISVADTFALFDAFYEAGGNFIDTAHVYAVWQPGGEGASERTVGQWFKSRALRDQIIIATKGAHPHLNTMHIPRMSRDEIMRDLNESLSRLGINVIDLYWLHRDALNVPVEEILEMMDGFVRDGKIRYWGGSNWTPARIHAANVYARSCSMAGIVASQPLGSLAKPNMDAIPDKTLTALDDRTLEFHRETGLPVVPYTSQAKGYFTKRTENRLKPDDHAWYDNPINDRRYERVQEVARRYGTSITAISLAYLTSQPFPCTPIIGPHDLPQLHDSLSAADLTLTMDDIAYLEANQPSYE